MCVSAENCPSKVLTLFLILLALLSPGAHRSSLQLNDRVVRCLMNQEDKPISSNRRNAVVSIRISWLSYVFALLLMGSIIEPGLSQVASNQIVGQSLPGQQLVSKNQLLIPPKALKATDRAR